MMTDNDRKAWGWGWARSYRGGLRRPQARWDPESTSEHATYPAAFSLRLPVALAPSRPGELPLPASARTVKVKLFWSEPPMSAARDMPEVPS